MPSHKCLLSTLDYRQVEQGRIVCSPTRGGCGGEYRFVRSKGGWVFLSAESAVA